MTMQDAFSGMINYHNVLPGVARSSAMFARSLMSVLQTSSRQLRLMDQQHQNEQQQSDDNCASATESDESSSEDVTAQD